LKEAIVRMIQNYTDSPFYPSASMVQGLIQSNILSMIKNGVVQINHPNPNYVQPDNNSNTPAPVTWDGTNASLANISTDVQFLLVSVPVDLGNPDDPITTAVAAAKEIISKLWRQEDTPYIAGYEITWSQLFFAPVYLNPGGILQDPRDVIPEYFLSPNQTGVIPRGMQTTNFGGDLDPPLAPGQSTIFDQLVQINPQCFSSDGTRTGQLIFSSLRKADRYRYERTWFKVDHSWLVSPVGAWDADLYTSGDGPQNALDFNVLPGARG
jgi:hypothetical protein